MARVSFNTAFPSWTTRLAKSGPKLNKGKMKVYDLHFETPTPTPNRIYDRSPLAWVFFNTAFPKLDHQAEPSVDLFGYVGVPRSNDDDSRNIRCKFRADVIVIHVIAKTSYAVLREEVVKNLNGVLGVNFRLAYSIMGGSKCLLRNNQDVTLMFHCQRMVRSEFVDIIVEMDMADFREDIAVADTSMQGVIEELSPFDFGVRRPGRIYPLDFAVVSSESQVHWTWFVEHVAVILKEQGRNVTFMTYWNPGLLNAVKSTFPEAPHGFCMHHKMQSAIQRSDDAIKWSSTLCPKIEKNLIVNAHFGRHFGIVKASHAEYEVNDQGKFTVNVFKGTYSCGMWRINSFPCPHAAAVFKRAGLDTYKHIESYFRDTTFRACYSFPIHPIPNVLDCVADAGDAGYICPPETKRQAGKPKLKRLKPRVLEVRKMKCSRCGKKEGHNRKTCNEPI
ncbi:hypothetical protein LguiA_003826 [Lonicera macranthoides]